MLPCYTATANGGTSPLYSPFDGFGTGVTSPLCLLSSFQVVLSGGGWEYFGDGIGQDAVERVLSVLDDRRETDTE